MKIRTTHVRATGLALAAALALGACSKAPTVEVNGQAAQEAAAGNGASGAPAASSSSASVNVQSKVSTLAVHADPATSSPVVTSLKGTTKLGSKTTLLVTDTKPGWFQVSLPTRPNGSSGWVEAADVTPRSNDAVINVDLASRQVSVQKGDHLIAKTTVAIGADATPTPTGTFYVTDFVQTDAKGDYGPFAFGLSAHSETLTEFAGGDGQVAVHGTNDPSSIGQAVSHGCVRLPNDVVTQLAATVSLGTPVIII